MFIKTNEHILMMIIKNIQDVFEKTRPTE